MDTPPLLDPESTGYLSARKRSKGRSRKRSSQPPKPGTEERRKSSHETSSRPSSPQKERPEKPPPPMYKTYPNDERVRTIERSYAELPDTIKSKIEKNGIKPEELTGPKLAYIWHIVWFLYRKNFDSNLVLHERSSSRKPTISEEAMIEAKKQVIHLDVPVKKVFPTLEFEAEGAFGQVFTGKMVIPGKKKKQRVAVKKLRHDSDKFILDNLCELYFMQTLVHPNSVTCMGCYLTPTDPKTKAKIPQLLIAMEWLQGGTLRYASSYAGGKKFKDAHVAFVARECFRALSFMHARNFAHRDLKSTNVMLSIYGDVKLIDFGLACDMTPGRRCKMLGSPMWVPPEMIQSRPHGLNVDVWSMAVCILELYLGGPPLRKKSIQCMYTAATEGFAQFVPADASENAKSFITQCLTMDPDHRPSAFTLLEHPWVNSEHDLSAGIQIILKQIFLARSLNMAA